MTSLMSLLRSNASLGRTAVLVAALALVGSAAPAARAVDVVSTGATWKYLDDGSDQGTAWRGTGFDDNSWDSGPAQLGYGDGDEATVVNGGPVGNRFITTYFRHTFNVTDPSSIAGLELRILRDDGAVVHLNGNPDHQHQHAGRRYRLSDGRGHRDRRRQRARVPPLPGEPRDARGRRQPAGGGDPPGFERELGHQLRPRARHRRGAGTAVARARALPPDRDSHPAWWCAGGPTW